MTPSSSAPSAARDAPARRGASPWLARALWLAGVILGCAVLVVAILHMRPSSFGLEPPGRVPLLESVNYGYYQVILSQAMDILFVAVFMAVGLVIAWRRSSDGYTLAVSLALILYGITSTLAVQVLQQAESGWGWLAHFLSMASTASVPILAYLFPDGRFVPRWTRWLALLWGTLGLAATFVRTLDPYTWPPWYLYAFMLLGLGTAIGAQVYRYRRVSTPTQQQQTKWVVFGFAAAMLGFAAVSGLLWLTPWARGVAFLQFLYAHWSLYLSQLIVPVCIGFSVMRYRLWDIDLVINRTVVYTITVGLVVTLFWLLSNAGDLAVKAIFGQTSALAPLGSLLVSAMVFSPLQERTQTYVDRRFYREKVDLQTAFADFFHDIRRFTDVDSLLHSLVDTVGNLLHVEQSAVYVSEGGSSFRLAAARALPGAQLQEWTPAAEALHKLEMGLGVAQADDRVFPLLIPLSLPPAARAGNPDWERWLGVLALGPRLSGRGFSREDRALLLTLADQVGTAVYVALTLQQKQGS
jgi:hypothetical protein